MELVGTAFIEPGSLLKIRVPQAEVSREEWLLGTAWTINVGDARWRGILKSVRGAPDIDGIEVEIELLDSTPVTYRQS